jgi:phage anti-repressor protein
MTHAEQCATCALKQTQWEPYHHCSIYAHPPISVCSHHTTDEHARKVVMIERDDRTGDMFGDSGEG